MKMIAMEVSCRRSDLAFHPQEATAKLISPPNNARQAIKLNFTVALN